MKILLTEDELDHQELIVEALGRFDPAWEVDIATTGEQALEKLAANTYDLILMDHNLPGENGLQITQEINGNEGAAPIIMITGQGNEKIAAEVIKSGAYDYVVKEPGYFSKLPQIIQRARQDFQEKNARLLAERALLVSNEHLELLHQIDRAILSAQTTREIASHVIPKLHGLVPCQVSSIALIDLVEQKAVFLAVQSQLEGIPIKGQTVIPLSELAQFISVLKTGNCVLIEDIQMLPDKPPIIEQLLKSGGRAYLAAPLKFGDSLLGLINLAATQPGAFNQDSIEIVRQVANSLAIALHQASLYERVIQDAAELESRVEEGVAENKNLFDMMVGREVRMAELKRVIKKLRKQLFAAGMQPVADDPLNEGL